MKIFYIRVSSLDQNIARQKEMAKECKAEKLFIDKMSGKNAKDRPQLNKMLEFARAGDVVICESFSRIARNTIDLLTIVDKLKKKKVSFVSLKEKVDTATPSGKFMITVFGGLAELERENIRARQAEGIEIAKKQGKYKGKAPREYDKVKFKEAVNDVKEGKRTATSVAREFKISYMTYFRWAKKVK
ncbi:MAG: recombinase family protein [Bacilli bacterium]|nr:recombinase family protein [Bacilli bacterium]